MDLLLLLLLKLRIYYIIIIIIVHITFGPSIRSIKKIDIYVPINLLCSR